MRNPRRWALVLVAVLHLTMATTVPYDRIDPVLARLHEMLPGELRVLLWVLGALIAAAGAIRPGLERAAFVAAVLMPAERALSHLWSWSAWIIPGVPAGDPHGWQGAIVWAVLAGLVMILAYPHQRADDGA